MFSYLSKVLTKKINFKCQKVSICLLFIIPLETLQLVSQYILLYVYQHLPPNEMLDCSTAKFDNLADKWALIHEISFPPAKVWLLPSLFIAHKSMRVSHSCTVYICINSKNVCTCCCTFLKLELPNIYENLIY